MTDMQMAMIVASWTWHGAVISDGAIAILNDVYGPHKFCGERRDCSRCGRLRENKIHD